MTTYAEATPAYGRDYKSAKAVKADWAAGKDFLLQDLYHSGYVNKDDLPEGVVLLVRYAKLTKVVQV